MIGRGHSPLCLIYDDYNNRTKMIITTEQIGSEYKEQILYVPTRDLCDVAETDFSAKSDVSWFDIDFLSDNFTDYTYFPNFSPTIAEKLNLYRQTRDSLNKGIIKAFLNSDDGSILQAYVEDCKALLSNYEECFIYIFESAELGGICFDDEIAEWRKKAIKKRDNYTSINKALDIINFRGDKRIFLIGTDLCGYIKERLSIPYSVEMLCRLPSYNGIVFRMNYRSFVAMGGVNVRANKPETGILPLKIDEKVKRTLQTYLGYGAENWTDDYLYRYLLQLEHINVEECHLYEKLLSTYNDLPNLYMFYNNYRLCDLLEAPMKDTERTNKVEAIINSMIETSKNYLENVAYRLNYYNGIDYTNISHTLSNTECLKNFVSDVYKFRKTSFEEIGVECVEDLISYIFPSGETNGKNKLTFDFTDIDFAETKTDAKQFIFSIILYRKYSSAKSSLCGVLAERPRFNPMSTVTKRWTSGWQTVNHEAPIMKIFVPREGKLFFYFDVKSAEVRFSAYLSGDKKLIALFESGGDPYLHLARVCGEEFPSAMRGVYKTCLLAQLYGQSVNGLAYRLGISVEKAQVIVDTLRALYPTLFKWISEKQSYGIQNGKVDTLLGDNIFLSRQDSIETQKKYAVNYLVQGSSAIVMADGFYNFCQSYKNKGIVPIMVIHDALLFEAPIAEKDNISAYIEQTFTNYIYDRFGVRLDYEISSGSTYRTLGTNDDILTISECMEEFKKDHTVAIF